MAGSSFAACGDLTHKQNTLLSFSQAECFRPLEIFHSRENDTCLGKDKFLVWCSQHLQHWLMYTLGVFSIRPVVSINKGGCALLPFTENSAFHHCPAAWHFASVSWLPLSGSHVTYYGVLYKCSKWNAHLVFCFISSFHVSWSFKLLYFWTLWFCFWLLSCEESLTSIINSI